MKISFLRSLPPDWFLQRQTARVCRDLGFSVALGLAASLSARADEAMITDRPDFVESSAVVGVGHFQIEAGFAAQRDQGGGAKSRITTTPTLLRFGVSETVELRAETDGYTHSKIQDATSGITRSERGFADLSLGLKWRTQEADEALGRPAIAWLAHIDADSGASPFRGQGWRPSVRVVAEWDLPHDFSIGVMPGLFADNNPDGRRFIAGILAVTVGKEWTPAWHSFVELAGERLASSHNGGSIVIFDTGVAYLVTDTLQVDFAVSRGLNSNAPDFQWGAGVSVRF